MDMTTPPPKPGVLAAYEALLANAELRADAEQRHVAGRLEALATALADAPEPAKPGLLARLFGRAPDRPPEAPRGLYIWGKVGRGKSMLMDLFFAHGPETSKRRVHFHEFMLEVHSLIHDYRTLDAPARARAFPGAIGDDPMPPVAARIAGQARLLCFDEMQVTDIADAMILGRLFTALFAHGVTVVTTSNRPPADLYKDGLNRALFLPFIDLLEQRLDVLSLNGPTDYRMERMAGLETYLVPNGPAASDKLAHAFFRMTDFSIEDRARVPSETIDVQGRPLFVPKSLKGVAVFSFKRLCAQALGAADYLAIARRFHTVILVGIPVLSPEKRNEAKRFVTLIDALYEHRVKLLCAADAAPADLYPAGDGAFEFERTVSRLMEMQSDRYLALGHGKVG
jgi:cell division protein ZapE